MLIYKAFYACDHFEIFPTLPYTIHMYHKIYVDDIT
jgi:hypothetical protein